MIRTLEHASVLSFYYDRSHDVFAELFDLLWYTHRRRPEVFSILSGDIKCEELS